MNILEFSVNEIKAFILILFRISGIFFASPFLGSNLVMSRVKIGLAFLVAYLVYPIVIFIPEQLPASLISYFLVVVSELMFGLFLGYLFFLVFIGIQFAGQLIGLQMGLGIVNVLDPQTNVQISIIAQMKFIFALLIFLSINGHYVIIEAAVRCFEILPLGLIKYPVELQSKLIELTGYVFVFLFKLGAPVIITMYITEISMGIIARTVPQMNIFIVGFPVKIGVGLFALSVMFPLWVVGFKKLLNQFSAEWVNLITYFK